MQATGRYHSCGLGELPHAGASGASECLVLQADFSGSWDVTSRNSLIHIGATTATKLERFDAEGVPACCCRVLTAASERLLATVNFAEFLFHAIRWIRDYRYAPCATKPPSRCPVGARAYRARAYRCSAHSPTVGAGCPGSRSDRRYCPP